MELIDWAGLARNALWILGLSVMLAAFSYTSWRASRSRVRLRQALGWPTFHAAFSAGCMLFAGGLAWSATRLWERLAWLALLVAFGWQWVAAALAIRRSRDRYSDGE